MPERAGEGGYVERRVQCVIWTLELGPDERIIGADHEGNTAWVYIEGPPFDD